MSLFAKKIYKVKIYKLYIDKFVMIIRIVSLEKIILYEIGKENIWKIMINYEK